MQKWLVLAVCSLLMSLGVQASQIEDQTTQVHPALVYQEDFHVAGDAPGTCETVDSQRVVEFEDEAHGLLVDYDDTSDAVIAKVDPAAIGERMGLEVRLGDTRVAGIEFDFDVYDMNCNYSVFDSEAPIYQSTDDRPASSFEVGEGEQLASATTFDDYACNESEWKAQVKINKDSVAPGQVYMEWTDGSYAYVDLHHESEGTVSMYLHHGNLDVSLAKIEAVVADNWDGWLKLAHGPCDVEDGEIPEPPETGEKAGLNAEWTALDESYIVVIRISKGVQDVVDEHTGTAVGLVMDPPTSVPMRCHTICTSFSGDSAYNLLTQQVE